MSRMPLDNQMESLGEQLLESLLLEWLAIDLGFSPLDPRSYRILEMPYPYPA